MSASMDRRNQLRRDQIMDVMAEKQVGTTKGGGDGRASEEVLEYENKEVGY